ncbi:FkbM family methyltransferase [Ramlibacter sp. AN1133]|uniref:FkbM family methyltransferase n=1 Tax=Ramlibacter sp. AN1133 TaxID=3133429 RepID=UPI0030C23F5B
MVLSKLAMAVARSTGIVGYRGAGRIFRRLSHIPAFRDSEGVADLGARKITFPAFDPYWAQYLWTRKTYEPDVEAIFQALSPIPHKVLVDCGANIGFWTIKLSNPSYGFDRLIAVEANPYVFEYLRRNVQINGLEVDCRHAAIAEESGHMVHIDGSQGHAVGVVGSVGTPVGTVSLRSLLDGIDGLAVVKLDVEGSEVPAIRGGESVRADVLYVYEDWPRSGLPVSVHLLGRGYSIIGVHPDGRSERLSSLEAIHDFNRRSAPGYHPANLVATRKPQLYPAP